MSHPGGGYWVLHVIILMHSHWDSVGPRLPSKMRHLNELAAAGFIIQEFYASGHIRLPALHVFKSTVCRRKDTGYPHVTSCQSLMARG